MWDVRVWDVGVCYVGCEVCDVGCEGVMWDVRV